MSRRIGSKNLGSGLIHHVTDAIAIRFGGLGGSMATAEELLLLANRVCNSHDHPGLTLMGLRTLLFEYRRWSQVFGQGDSPFLKGACGIVDREFERRRKKR